MKNKILLIYPKIETVVIQAPLSVLSLASVLKREGFEVQIIDRRVTKNSEKLIKQSIQKGNIISVGISIMTGSQIKDAIKISKFIKNISNIPVIYGGVHPTFLPEQTLKNNYVDFVVMGMGEISFLNLNMALVSNEKNLSEIKGIGYRINEKIFLNSYSHDDIKLDSLPPPAWDMVDVKHYLEQGLLGKYTLTLITSRGCPHRCTFCYGSNFFNRKWYKRSTENVLKEVDNLLEKYPMDSIYFNDDNFIVDRKRMFEICRGLKDRDIKYGIFSRAEYINEQLIKFLKENNCLRVAIGAESGSQRILDILKKDIKIKDILNVARLCGKYEIKCSFSFMVGHPLETEEDMNKTLDLIDKIIEINPSSEITDLKIMTPYPGTEFYDTAIKHGFKPPQTLEKWGDFEWNKCKLPWIKNKKMYETMSLAVLLNFYTHRIKRGNIISKILIDLLHKIESLRWKHRFWNFGIEVYLIKYYLRLFS